MTFMEEVTARSMDLWEKAANVSFLEEMGKNVLDRQQFLSYIVQDSIYLRDYLKAFAMGIFKSRSLKEMQVFYSVLGFVNDSENATRLKYLADGGMTDAAVEYIAKKPACQAYTEFLLDTARQEDVPEILMAVMPCMLGYYYVFKALLEKYPSVLDTYYGPLVRDYTSEEYRQSCDYWSDYCNEVCGGLDEERKEKLGAIFETASRHELYFWEMAGEKSDAGELHTQLACAKDGCSDCNERVRKNVPLVHCITNYVTVNDVANALLSCGGSPIMADDIGEASQITSISSALVINIGTLNARTIESMIEAGKTANAGNIPVVLDPVGAGASSLRNDTVNRLLKEVKFTVIRGNLSEISFVAGMDVSTRGVDSSEADSGNDAAAVAKAAASKYGCVTAVTGAEDIISDGVRAARIKNGVPQMSRITGTGCMLSGVIGAYVGANEDTFNAAVSAVASMGIAGEIAWEENGKRGTGSLHIGIIDALSRIDDEMIKKRGKIQYEA